MKLIYKASDITEAHIVSGLLNANGVEAHVGGHYLQGGVGELAALDFANVHVADKDASVAKSIIAEYEGGQDKPDEITTIRKTPFTSRLLLVILATALIVLIYYLIASFL
jgi:hypothetical protein